MAAKDKLFAQFTMLNYIAGSRDRTVQEILEYLRENTNWGRAQIRPGRANDPGLRNVQNWLKDICATPEFAASIQHRVDPDDKRQHIYRSTAPTVGQRIMPVEEACLVLMAEKFLEAAIPADFYDAALQDLFRAARAHADVRRQVQRHVQAVEQPASGSDHSLERVCRGRAANG